MITKSNPGEQKTGGLGLPWTVYHGKLRPQFSTVIYEIQDVEGRAVVAWTGFDGLGFTREEVAARVNLIVTAVNAFAELERERDALREALTELAEKADRASLVQDRSVRLIKQACTYI